jgi:hypothetical protein
MIDNHQEFIECIHNKSKASITYFSKKAGSNITRTIAPIDYGKNIRYKTNAPYYHFWDFDSPDIPHHTCKQDHEIASFVPLAEKIDLSEIQQWTTPYSILRDWDYSGR